jgi:hypothetical protein
MMANDQPFDGPLDGRSEDVNVARRRSSASAFRLMRSCAQPCRRLDDRLTDSHRPLLARRGKSLARRYRYASPRLMNRGNAELSGFAATISAVLSKPVPKQLAIAYIALPKYRCAIAAGARRANDDWSDDVMDCSQKRFMFGDDGASSRQVSAGVVPQRKSAGAAKPISMNGLSEGENGK